MDSWDEKDGEKVARRRERGNRTVSFEPYPTQHTNRESTTSDIIDRMVDDIDKANRPPSINDGTDRERHLSAEMEADRDKRESVETSNYRFSQFTATTDFEDEDSEKAREKEKEKEKEAGVLPAVRPPNNRAGVSMATTAGSRRSMPSLRRKETKLAQKEAHPWQHLGITLGLPMVLLFDLVVPCIIYYTWYISHRNTWRSDCNAQFPGQNPCPLPRPEYDSDILGYAIICFGFGEIWILFSRIHRLFFHRDECAPLLSRNRWELDATSWVYGVAVLMALIPFVIGSSLELQHLYLYSPTFIMGFLGLLMVVTTLTPFTLPIGINSQPRGTKLRPFIYYAAEDFIAVDGLQDREFRVRYNERYETNRRFRRLFTILTMWWLLGVAVYVGCVSAVIWNCEFHVAFGLSFGVLFSYIVCWAGGTLLIVNWEMKREHEEYENEEVQA